MIDILLSTYNGEKYIVDLLDSLNSQTYKEIRVLIRDDGSKDSTLDLIRNYKSNHSLAINVMDDCQGNIGSTASFEMLIRYSTADYYMFCDQDDVWLPQKIELSLKKIEELEIQYPNLPLMVFSDLLVVDEKLNIISDSYFRSQRISPNVCFNPWQCMALSVVAGCTMLLNKLSKECILPIPNFLIHDHWIASNIAYYGKCTYLTTPTILYRQHGENSVGAVAVGNKYLINRLSLPVKSIKLYYSELRAFKFKINFVSFFYYKIKFYLLRLLTVKYWQ